MVGNKEIYTLSVKTNAQNIGIDLKVKPKDDVRLRNPGDHHSHKPQGMFSRSHH